MEATHEACPWNQPDAATWLSGNEALRRFVRLIRKTLDNDPRQFPLQMRAAAAMVILLCRRGLWPASGGQPELDEVVGQARRNLALIRQLYSVESKRREDVGGHESLNHLLRAIEDEMRILDARLSEKPLNIPDSPPETWGKIWPTR